MNILELNQIIELVDKDLLEQGELNKSRTWVLKEMVAAIKWLLKEREGAKWLIDTTKPLTPAEAKVFQPILDNAVMERENC